MSYYSTNILNKYAKNYENPTTVKNDLNEVIKTYGTLRLKYENLTHNDGTTEELLLFDGTVPIKYQNSQYNIPVNIYYPMNFPSSPPLVYVRPTSDMNIKISPNVNPEGFVTIPYLKDWRSGYTSKILISLLINIFGDSPPVFAKSKYTNTSVTPPYPTSNPLPYPTSIPSNLPYPVANNNLPYPTSGPSSGYPGQVITPGYPSYPAQPKTTPYPSSIGSYGSSSSYPAYDSTIKPVHLQDSLKSAIAEKLKRIADEKKTQYQSEMQSLIQVQEDLKIGKNKLLSMIEGMKRELSNVESANESLDQMNEKLEKMKIEVDQKADEPLDVDEMVTASYPLFKQLTDSFSEEQAIEDALYNLGKALEHNIINHETFLRKVRAYSRRQFILRATVIACRKKARLDL